jgi:hypothetical protein
MKNFPLDFFFPFYILTFISHEEMHEKFLITLCICHFVRSTFNGEVHWEFAFGFLFACSYYQFSHHMDKHMENFPLPILFALSITTLHGPFTYSS